MGRRDAGLSGSQDKPVPVGAAFPAAPEAFRCGLPGAHKDRLCPAVLTLGLAWREQGRRAGLPEAW